MEIPEDWEKRKLSDFLDAEDIAYFNQVWDENGGDEMAFMDAMKPWFEDTDTVQKLKSKGLDAGFAKYFLPYHYAMAMKAVEAVGVDAIVDRIMRRPPPGDPSLN